MRKGLSPVACQGGLDNATLLPMLFFRVPTFILWYEIQQVVWLPEIEDRLYARAKSAEQTLDGQEKGGISTVLSARKICSMP